MILKTPRQHSHVLGRQFAQWPIRAEPLRPIGDVTLPNAAQEDGLSQSEVHQRE
jgi:hypothetical protein